MFDTPKLKDRLKKTYEWVDSGVNRALDLGGELSEIGHLPGELVKKCKQVYVVNIEKGSLGAIKKTIGRKVHLILADAQNLPFVEASFDLIIMNDVIEHLSDDKSAFRELKRLLIPGGVIIISVPHRGIFTFLDPMNVKVDFYSIYNTFLKMISIFKRNRIEIHKRNISLRHRHYTLKELELLLLDEFTIKKVWRGGCLLYPFSNLILNILEKINFFFFIQKLMRMFMNIDFMIPYGRLSYNMVIFAKKKTSSLKIEL
ncbi:MAG: class I SAM-dependent methyltransferase [Thermodesulfobacteriota bacterium]|nr:class I SAM-dependent methyltransferase [Thermodesulfobacteriota bacterium]